VLGPASDLAAAAALAAAKQGKYLPFHRALFSGGHPDANGIAAAAQVAGLSPASLATTGKSPDVRMEIQTNLELARRLGIEATPFFVIGNRVLQGAVGYDRLAAAVAEARSDAQ
jgi:protein-disulfide isomerase